MADIFVSYTSSDRNWAFWIGRKLTNLGDAPHLHEWEIPAGGDIPAWMEARLQEADRVLCVVSAEYLIKEYSGWERRAAHWAVASKRPNFMLLVLIEDCEVPIALAHIKRCNLFGLGVDDARALESLAFHGAARMGREQARDLREHRQCRVGEPDLRRSALPYLRRNRTVAA